MALSHFSSAAFIGLEAYLIDVEVDAHLAEETGLVLVGLPDTSVRESKDRVMAATRNSGFLQGNIRATINLAPGDLRKEGPLYDLPIAIGLVHALQKKSPSSLERQYIIVGELALSGDVRPIHGALAIAMLARTLGMRGVILPQANACEAAAVPGVEVIPVSTLKEAVLFLSDPTKFKPQLKPPPVPPTAVAAHFVDFSDIKGHIHVKRALEIAAAGGHNVLLCGPPGSGKTLMAKALGGIIPEMTIDEALEVTKIHSIAGLMPAGQSVITERPFRSPHHTISYAGLIGGGTYPRPGEVSLAHNGVLFLDELPEFSRAVLEVLRQPLEDRKVTISRANGNITFPTSFICIAAMNPCPCGLRGHPDKPCQDTDLQVQRYQSRISGPVRDRIDMHIDVPILRYADLHTSGSGETTAVIRTRVATARQRQHQRFGNAKVNAQMSVREIKTYCCPDASCQAVLKHAMDDLSLSARACDRLLRVARTIADLEGCEKMTAAHLMEALSFRS